MTLCCTGSQGLSYSQLMHASWLLRSSPGQPIQAMVGMRLMRARVQPNQPTLPAMQVRFCITKVGPM